MNANGIFIRVYLRKSAAEKFCLSPCLCVCVVGFVPVLILLSVPLWPLLFPVYLRSSA